jgi:hypothetical protein
MSTSVALFLAVPALVTGCLALVTAFVTGCLALVTAFVTGLFSLLVALLPYIATFGNKAIYLTCAGVLAWRSRNWMRVLAAVANGDRLEVDAFETSGASPPAERRL